MKAYIRVYIYIRRGWPPGAPGATALLRLIRLLASIRIVLLDLRKMLFLTSLSFRTSVHNLFRKLDRALETGIYMYANRNM